MPRDLYELLGVEPTATQEDVGRAFRRRAATEHPDKHPGDSAAEERFKELAAAFHVLSDPDARRRYDLSRAADRIRDFSSDMRDIFNVKTGSAPRTAHGQAGSPFTAAPGYDASASVDVTFHESVTGCKKPVAVRVNRATEECKACSGSGGAPGAARVQCAVCSGHGRRVDPRGRMALKECQTCRGRGTVSLVTCDSCGGRGLTELERNLTVTIPRGVKSGTVLRVAGMGGPGSPPGDLYIEVKVVGDGTYERRGDELRIRHTVSMFGAILGTAVNVVPFPGKTVTVTVPPGSQPGDEIRSETVELPGGDRVTVTVVLNVVLPKLVSPRGKQLLKDLLDEVVKLGAY